MERQDVDAAGLRQVADRAEGAHDLVGARHEDQDVAFRLLQQDAPDLLRRGVPHGSRGIARLVRVLDVDREGAAIGGERLGRTEPPGHALRVERGGHRDQQEVGAAGLLESARQREGDVRMQVALVELVEDDRPNPLELRVGGHLAEQQGLGHELDAGLRRFDPLEADLVADLRPELAAPLLRDARGEQAGGDPPGLQHDDLPLDQTEVQQHLRNTRRLARARRGAQDEAPRPPAGGDQVGLQQVDGQGLAHASGRSINRAEARPSRKVRRATVTGRLKRRGPALPGLSRSTPPSSEMRGTWVWPVITTSGR